MKLIKDLGTRLCGKKRPMTKRFGLYKCPVCESHFEARTSNVQSGNTTKCTSCSSKIKQTTHGKSAHPLYATWKGILERTGNPNSPSYKGYGGRGIKVCKEWRETPDAFITWAEANDYAPGLTLDRIDVNGDYEPNNCRFTTNFIQGQNTRRLNTRNKSGYRGVSYDRKRKKWQAHIKANGVNHALGRYETAEDAARAYDAFIIENGTAHPLNFPEE